jgi:erlin
LDLQQDTVGNALLSHEINQFCSGHTVQEVLIEKFNTLDESLRESLQKGCNEWAPGIESKTANHSVIAVRVTKPSVPDVIAKSYEDREIERTKLLIKKE